MAKRACSRSQRSLGEAIVTLDGVGSEKARIIRVTEIGIDIELASDVKFEQLDVVSVDYQLSNHDPECDLLAVVTHKDKRELHLRFAA